MSAGDLSTQARVSCDSSSRNCVSVASSPSVAIEAGDCANSDKSPSARQLCQYHSHAHVFAVPPIQAMGRRWSGDVSSTTYLAGYRLELSDVDLQGILDRDTQRTVEGAKGALGP